MGTTTTTDRRQELLGQALSTSPVQTTIRQAIVRTVIYADIFEYPLHESEVHRYLIGYRAEPQTVRLALKDHLRPGGPLMKRGGYIFLRRREALIRTRRHRAALAAGLWPTAARYGRALGALPFVRMVAVTGALAMDNVEARADVDYLIVTRAGRLWTCRALAILVVHQAAARGIQLCPNYFLSERRLVLEERNLFSAHELVQMVPLTGPEIYFRMRALNAWTETFLPNASGPPSHDLRPWNEQLPYGLDRLAALAEGVLGSRPGERLEIWEMRRKIRRLARQSEALEAEAAGASLEASFSPEWCKGHLSGHGRRTLEAYAKQVERMEASWR